MRCVLLLICLSTVLTLGGQVGCSGTEDSGSGDGDCVDCGTLANGDTDITGDVLLDGFFEAVLQLKTVFDTVEANHEAQLDGMLLVLGEEGIDGLNLAEKTALVKTGLAAEMNANLAGGVANWFEPPVCYSNSGSALEFQGLCEAFYGCDVSGECSGEEASFGCEGVCLGSCTGGCAGSLLCPLDMGTGGDCAAICDGICSVPSTGICNEICFGDCDTGQCSDGCLCDGNCVGECVDFGDLACSGTCDGDCIVVVSSEIECVSGALCAGGCTGECFGNCYGKITAPSCVVDADCSVSGICEDVSSLIGFAYASCDASWLGLYYQMDAAVGVEAAAEFHAKMASVEDAMASIMDGRDLLGLLMGSNTTAELGITPLVMELSVFVEIIIAAGLDGFNMDPGKECCLIDAIEEVAEIIIDLSSRHGVLALSQLELATVFELE